MIGTDKYEGHAEGDWNWTKLGTMSGILLDKHGKDIVHLMMPYDLYSNPTDATAQLIADAPLLLEEVKRLRDELDTQYEYIEWLEEFAPKAGEYNTSWDAYELAKGIHWTQMEEEE